MSKAAYLWIRDGVLINRMPLNAVAFALSVLDVLDPVGHAADDLSLENLINFAFEKSGVSCAEKVQMYRSERHEFSQQYERPIVERYVEISGIAGPHCRYFDGVVELLTELHDSGHANFITSAVAQEELDAWLSGDQGSAVRPVLREAMGRRLSFAKGEPHFRHVHDQGLAPIYLIADAVAEITMGKNAAQQFGVVPVGFANVIEPSDIEAALRLIESTTGAKHRPIDLDILRLPDKAELVQSLKDAGADCIIPYPLHKPIPTCLQGQRR